VTGLEHDVIHVGGRVVVLDEREAMARGELPRVPGAARGQRVQLRRLEPDARPASPTARFG